MPAPRLWPGEREVLGRKGLGVLRRPAGISRRPSWIPRSLSRFAGDRRGNVLIFTGIGVFALIGAAGLGTEVASWYAQKRSMQNAADLGADSAILSLKNNLTSASGTTDGYAQKEAKTSTAQHGYADGSNGTTVTVNIPPTSGSYTGASYNHKAVEVIVSKPASLLFSSLFLPSAPTVNARSVAVISVSGNDCMLTTDPSSAKSAYFQGSFSINVPCGLADMSTSPNAIMTTGGAGNLTASTVRTAGGISDPGGTIHATEITDDNSISDPYAGRTLPTLGSGYPTGSSWPGNKLQTVSPTNIYNGNITSTTNSTTLFPSGCTSGCVINGNINLSGTLTLSNGVYFVTGSISLGSNSTLTTSGATIILTNTNANNIGTVSMQATANLNLLAPSSTSGDPGYAVTQNFSGLAGLALIQDPRASRASIQTNGQGNWCSGNCSSFQGTTSSSITGAIYFPMGGITWQGDNVTQGCLQLIGSALNLAGNPGVNVTNCTQGETLFGPTLVRLAE